MTSTQLKYLKMVKNLPDKENKKELKWFRKTIINTKTKK